MLQNKNGIVFGVANKRSIAWGIAQKLQQAGAQLAITYQNERLAADVFFAALLWSFSVNTPAARSNDAPAGSRPSKERRPSASACSTSGEAPGLEQPPDPSHRVASVTITTGRDIDSQK